jgi:hypothetical protein
MASDLRVSLRAVAREMDVPSEDWTVYLNRQTGEMLSVNDEEVSLVENDDEPEECDDGTSEWPAEHLAKVREALDSEDYLPLPGKDEHDEYQLLDRFCRLEEDEHLRGKLLRAIEGRGAFRRFKDLVHESGREDAWHTFRDGALEDLAAEWLEANGIGYYREEAP